MRKAGSARGAPWRAPRGPLEARGPGQGPRSPMPKAATAQTGSPIPHFKRWPPEFFDEACPDLANNGYSARRRSHRNVLLE